MAEQQSSRHLPGAPSSGSSSKADSKLRLVGTDGKVVVPPDARISDASPTIISKKSPLADGINTPDTLAGKNLYGQRLAHFELLEPIGVGGMAAVLRARDTQLDRYVALKILPPETAEDEENIHRFHQEARAAAKLDHPNIAQVFFCGEDRGLHFIAFEFVEGDNLRTVMEKRGRLPVAESVRYIIQVALGLDHAASRGVVHRDIKPSNIIITPNGAAKLVDMGLARSLERQSDAGLTHSGMTLGTFDYISPEQALEPRDADCRSDIYSLGCTFYHLLTGQPPVPEGTAAKKLQHHQHVAPIDPRQLNPEIPDEVAAILLRMMAKDPAARYQKPVQLVQHLLQVAEKVGAGANVPEGAMFLDAPLPGAPRFRPVLTIVLSSLALGLLLLLISLAPSPKGPTNVNVGGNGEQQADVGNKLIVPPRPASPQVSEIGTTEELKLALEQGNQTFPLVKDVKLRNEAFTLQGRNLTIKGDPKDQNPKDRQQQKITFTYNQPPDAVKRVPCLTLKIDAGSTLTFDNICFELKFSDPLPEAIIAIEGPGKVEFKKCTVTMHELIARAPVPNRDVASLLIRNPRGDLKERPDVTLKECYFEQGQDAIAFEGPARLTATSCAFGPHNAVFAMRGDCPMGDKGPLSQVTLNHCSAFLVNGPAFLLDEKYFCSLHVSNSVFSNPSNPAGTDTPLIRQLTKDNESVLVRYTGNNNRYHGLSGLLFKASDIDSFNARLKGKTDEASPDVNSLVLAKSPWASAVPLQLLKEKDKQREAFQISLTMSEVRTSDDQLVGIKQCVWGKQQQPQQLQPAENIVKILPPADKEKIAAKYVDPDADEMNPPPGHYTNFAAAVATLPKSGGVIKIMHGKAGRTVPIDGVIMGNSDTNFELQILPAEGYRPVLTFAEKPDKSLFRLKDKFAGKVHFENLEFFLDSGDDKVTRDFPIGAVTLSSGDCSFRNCVFTMKRPSAGLQLSVASFADNRNEMGKDVDPKMMMLVFRAPQVSFEDCLVRGVGDLITIRSGRPVEVKIKNSLLALDGSAISLQGEYVTVAADQNARSPISINRVSGFVTEPFVRNKRMDALAPLRFEAVHDNLFVCLTPGEPFLSLDVDPENWNGRGNCYVKYDNLLQTQQRLAPLNRDGWTSSHEPDAVYSAAVFNLPAMITYSDLNLTHFRPQPSSQAMLARFGATLDAKTLPPFTTAYRFAD